MKSPNTKTRALILQNQAQTSSERAKDTLKHYFGVATNDSLNGDCWSEIDGIVDDIIEAAVARIQAECLRQEGGK